jgi:hypothetical protein
MLLRTSLAALAIAVASPALADAATYWGKLGSTDIVIELSSEFGDADEATVGRYLYAKKGIDIPLHVIEATAEKLVLYEELPCTRELCEPAFEASGPLPEELKGAVWTLSSEDGDTLKGTWVGKQGAKPIAIDMTLVGTRPFEPTEDMQPHQLAGLPFDIVDGKEGLNSSNYPYDFLKATTGEQAITEVMQMGGVSYIEVTDQRVKFPFPQLVDTGDFDQRDANQRLFTRQSVMIIAGLDCEAQASYFGMGWSPGAEMSLGSYAGYPDETVAVRYLSPTVMSWSESGSLYCGGAYPENHTYLTNIDMKTGQDLDLSKIFADSKMGEYRWEPGQSLIDLAIARRSKDEYAFGEECGIDELIATNLAVTFKEGDIAVFTLQGLPHVIQACQDDIFEAPLAELKAYLAPTATEFFPSLGN